MLVAWLAVLVELAEGGEVTPAELVERVPQFRVRTVSGSGKWRAEVPAERRVLNLLGER